MLFMFDLTGYHLQQLHGMLSLIYKYLFTNSDS